MFVFGFCFILVLHLYLDKCSLNVTLTTTSTSVGLRLLRPTSASGNVYTIELTSAGTMKSFTVSNGEDTISYSIPELNPFSTYSINITNGMARCLKTFVTLEGGKRKKY